jgi:predicted kinase
VMLSMLMGSAKSGKSANVEELQSEYNVQLREFRRFGLKGLRVLSERALACTEKALRF